jgi:hypothetical protein
MFFIVAAGMALQIDHSSELLRRVAFVSVFLVALASEVGVTRFDLPQRKRLVTTNVMMDETLGPIQFGFEMGTGFRTYSPSGLALLFGLSSLLFGRLNMIVPGAFGFALGRVTMPALRWRFGPTWTRQFLQARMGVLLPLYAAFALGFCTLANVG